MYVTMCTYNKLICLVCLYTMYVAGTQRVLKDTATLALSKDPVNVCEHQLTLQNSNSENKQLNNLNCVLYNYNVYVHVQLE